MPSPFDGAPLVYRGLQSQNMNTVSLCDQRTFKSSSSACTGDRGDLCARVGHQHPSLWRSCAWECGELPSLISSYIPRHTPKKAPKLKAGRTEEPIQLKVPLQTKDPEQKCCTDLVAINKTIFIGLGMFIWGLSVTEEPVDSTRFRNLRWVLLWRRASMQALK